MLSSQRLSYKYATVAILLFGVQGFVSNLGAIEIIFPDVPFPVPFPSGRAFHLNISIFWPLVGIIGGVFYFFSKEAEREIYSLKLANANFWLLCAGIAAIQGSVGLGLSEGREYLEALWPLKVAIALALVLLIYNLTRTYFASSVPRGRATLVSMLAGLFTLILFYAPVIPIYRHPTTDELMKFLVVHLWEEMSLELIGTGVLAAALIAVTGAKRSLIEGAVYLDLTFMAVTGILATGHHYYWIGVPPYWLWVGGLFSAAQVLPSILLFYTVFKTVKAGHFLNLGRRERLAAFFLGSSLVYHVFGAGLFGLFMAYPAINKYVHGTYLTSAHSHLALFGVFGFLVLAVCVYLLFSEMALSDRHYRLCLLAAAALNGGLLIMGLSLTAAGALQTYFWRVIGLSIGETNLLLKPYLIVRLAGGLVYFCGSSLLSFVVIKNVWANRQLLFGEPCSQGQAKSPLPAKLAGDFRCLVQKQKEMAFLVNRIHILQKISSILNEHLKGIKNKH